MKQQTKSIPGRIISFLLVLVMVAGLLQTGMLSLTVAAEETTGSGSKNDPMIVYNYGDLCKVMREAPTDGSTRYIKLGCDITTSPRDVYDKSYTHDYAETVDSRQKVVLDINGKTLKRTVKESLDWGIFYIHAGELTIISSDGLGVINSNFKQTIVVYGGKLTVEDNVFVTSEAENSKGITFKCGTLTVNGGIFDGMAYGLQISPSSLENSTVIINGGTFTSGICVEGFDQSSKDGTMLVRINNATVNGKAEFSTPGNEEGFASDIAQYTTVTVYDKNGKVKKIYKGSDESGRVNIEGDGYTIVFSSPEQVKDVLINSDNTFMLPKDGQTASDLHSSILYTYADGKSAVCDVEWDVADESGMKPFTGSFEAGKQYIADFSVACSDEYVFHSYDPPKITVGGGLNYDSCFTSVGDRTIRISIYFTVPAGKPVITKQPEHQQVYVGNSSAGTATFTLELENTYQAEYEWKAIDINGNVCPWESFDPSEGTVSGVNTDTLTISDIGFEYEHGYSFYCVVSTPSGSVTSDPAKIEITKDNNHTQTYTLNSSSTTEISESCVYDFVLDVGSTLNKNTYVWYKQVKVGTTYRWMPISTLEETLQLGVFSGYDKGQLRIETPSGETTDIADGQYRCTVTASDGSVTDYSAKVTIVHYFSDTCVDTGSDSTHGRYCRYCGTRTDEEHKIKWIAEREATSEQAGRRFFVCNECGYQSATESYQLVSGYYSHLTLDPNGGTIKNSTGTWETTLTENKIIVPTELLPETPAYAGHTFLGWSTDPDDTKPMYEPDEKVMLYGVITLYAIWEESTGTVVYLERVDVSIDEPVKGETKLSLNPVPLTEEFEYCKCSFVKYDSDGNWVGFIDENEPLESGVTYKLIIYAYIPYKQHQILSKIVPYINGEEVTLDYIGLKGEYKVAVMYTYYTVPEGVRVSGTVTSGGNERDDVTVSLIKDGETVPTFEKVIIGNTAYYSFAGVEAGSYTLQASKQDHFVSRQNIFVADSNVSKDIELSRAYTVFGSLTTYGSESDSVTFELLSDGGVESVCTTTVSGSNRSYSLYNILPGSYIMKVSKEGHTAQEYPLTVSSSDVKQDVTLWLTEDFNHDGTVNDLDNPFTDVKSVKWYFEPIMWAVSNGITDGMTPTTFEPDSLCTRAQVVTFIWRMYGCPEPKTSANPFKDVKASSWYYKAVLWAVENGITEGMSATTFEPNTKCTRAQGVTFIWRLAGTPEHESGTNPFKDVKSGSWYYKAVLWAVENGITDGMTANTFEPNTKCSRAHIVTFLYRYAEK